MSSCHTISVVDVVDVVGGVGGSTSIHNICKLPLTSTDISPYNEIDPSECPREFFATHLRAGRLKFRETIQHKPVFHDISLDNVLDMKLHVDLVASVDGDHLVLVI